jgi:DNA primase
MDLIDHLKNRGMDPYRYSLVVDDQEKIVTFYLQNGAGKIVGYQQYRPDCDNKKMNNAKESRYFTYLPANTDGVFGVDQLDPTKKQIYIVEGIFKAAILHRLGFNAIAVLGDNPKRLKSWFRILKANYELIAIGDNDSAGAGLIRKIGKGFQSPKDLDEMKDEEILNLIDIYSKTV